MYKRFYNKVLAILNQDINNDLSKHETSNLNQDINNDLSKHETSNLYLNLDIKKQISIKKPNIKNVGRMTYSCSTLKVYSVDTQIGSFCSIGQNVQIGHGDHPLNFLSTSPLFYFDNLGWKLNKAKSYNNFWTQKPVIIGNDVWIGDHAFIKNGIQVGDGAIIGAHSVVTKNIPPYAIVAGCPAKIIKYRFSENIIQELLDIQWWNLDNDILRQLNYDDINTSIKILKEKKNLNI